MELLAHLPDHSRIWIYQTDRPLSPAEQAISTEKLHEFIASWAAHGNQLYGGFAFINPFILLVAVDEQRVSASGCSIDSLTRFISGLGQSLNCDFFVRMKVTALKDDQWRQIDFSEINPAGHYKIVDTTIPYLGEFRKKGIVAPLESGLSRIFN